MAVIANITRPVVLIRAVGFIAAPLNPPAVALPAAGLAHTAADLNLAFLTIRAAVHMTIRATLMVPALRLLIIPTMTQVTAT